MKTLYVHYQNELVGELRQDDDLVYSFSYSESWIKGEHSFPLSLAMPLAQKDYANKITLSFFENLLPEGRIRSLLEKHHNLGGTFDFLAHYGQDCAGAITLSENPNGPKKSNTLTSINDLVEIKLELIMNAIEKKMSVADLIADSSPGYLSIAGAQDKFPAIFQNGKFYLPKNGSPTTHIVKTPIWRDGVKESVYNEYYCMELAHRVGLAVPQCQIVQDQYPLFVVHRYDRVQNTSGHVERLHQQDFCQAQGFTSDLKYEAKGGPTLHQNYELLLQHVSATEKLKCARQFLDWICFNLLIGNNDCHSKNISLLILKSYRITLAPFYDLLCTAIYPKLKRQFSFKIGNRDDFSRIGKAQFEILENQFGIKHGSMSLRMSEIHSAILEHKDTLATEMQKHNKEIKIPKRISQLIEKRSKGLRLQKVW